MSTKFFYQSVRWDSLKQEIHFVGAYLGGNRGRRFQVDGLKRIVAAGEKLYLCKIPCKVGKHMDETFKMFVLDDERIDGIGKENVQLVGQNVRGQFLLAKEFGEGMKRITRMNRVAKIDLGSKDSGS